MNATRGVGVERSRSERVWATRASMTREFCGWNSFTSRSCLRIYLEPSVVSMQ